MAPLLNHACIASLSTCAEGVLFYCTYPELPYCTIFSPLCNYSQLIFFSLSYILIAIVVINFFLKDFFFLTLIQRFLQELEIFYFQLIPAQSAVPIIPN